MTTGAPDGGGTAPAAYDALAASLEAPMVIVTTVGRDGERSGCLVGFATQCSIDPPRHLVGLSRANHTYGVARTASALAVHLVPAVRHDLAELFGATTGDDVDKFARCAWRPGPGGVPLLEGCPDWFVGEIVGRLPGEGDGPELDHELLVLAPVAVSGPPSPGARLCLTDVGDLHPGHEA